LDKKREAPIKPWPEKRHAPLQGEKRKQLKRGGICLPLAWRGEKRENKPEKEAREASDLEEMKSMENGQLVYWRSVR